MKRVFALTALVVALSVLFCLPAQGQQLYRGLSQVGALPVGTEEPCIANQCLMYAGDFDIGGQNPNALWNNSSLLFGITGATYVPVIVPRKFKGAKGKTDWNIQGLFTNQLFATPLATSVSWAIVTGVAENGNPNKVQTVCSGTGTPTLTATGRSGFGLTEFTILLTGAACPAGNLEAGQYWITFLPTVEDLSYLSDVEDNTPANAQGPGTEPVDQSFFLSVSFGFPNFANTTDPVVCGNIGCDSFSVGVIGNAVH